MANAFHWWPLIQPFAGVVLGGIISLASTLFMQNRAQKIEAKKKEREGRKAAAIQAFVGLTKLVRTFESIQNLSKHFDSQLQEAISEGRGDSQPYDIYKAVVGAPHEFESLAVEEFLFLAKGDGELIARIGEIQQRARNNEVVAREYSNERRSLDAFMLQHISQSSEVDGSVIKMDIDPVLKIKADLLQGQLNQMIIPLVIALEEDRISVHDIVNEYIEAARKEFGDDFPAKSIELRKSQKDANP